MTLQQIEQHAFTYYRKKYNCDLTDDQIKDEMDWIDWLAFVGEVVAKLKEVKPQPPTPPQDRVLREGEMPRKPQFYKP
jgi:hypothetical protein